MNFFRNSEKTQVMTNLHNYALDELQELVSSDSDNPDDKPVVRVKRQVVALGNAEGQKRVFVYVFFLMFFVAFNFNIGSVFVKVSCSTVDIMMICAAQTATKRRQPLRLLFSFDPRKFG